MRNCKRYNNKLWINNEIRYASTELKKLAWAIES